MGFEASFQAIPENCNLLMRARQEREIAEWVFFIHLFASYEAIPEHFKAKPLMEYMFSAMKALIRNHPGIEQRYFYAGNRTFDAIHYLLSPARRHNEWVNDLSLIKKALFGSELLQPEARSVQGFPIGFVPSSEVATLADYLDGVTTEELQEHYDALQMVEAGVYKMHTTGASRLPSIWEEFVGMRTVYRAAADHHEAVMAFMD